MISGMGISMIRTCWIWMLDGGRRGRGWITPSKMWCGKAITAITMQWISQGLASISPAHAYRFCSCGSATKVSIMLELLRRYCS